VCQRSLQDTTRAVAHNTGSRGEARVWRCERERERGEEGEDANIRLNRRGAGNCNTHAREAGARRSCVARDMASGCCQRPRARTDSAPSSSWSSSSSRGTLSRTFDRDDRGCMYVQMVRYAHASSLKQGRSSGGGRNSMQAGGCAKFRTTWTRSRRADILFRAVDASRAPCKLCTRTWHGRSKFGRIGQSSAE
jgi:hypothetical protein